MPRPASPLIPQLTALFLAIAVLAIGAPLAVVVDGVTVWLALLLVSLQAASLAASPRWPRTSVWVSAALLGPLSQAAQLGQENPWPVSVMSMIAYCGTLAMAGLSVTALGFGADRRGGWQLVAASAAALLIATARIYAGGPVHSSPGPLIANLVTFAGAIALTLLVVSLVRNWQEVRGQLQAQRTVAAEELARREVAEERTRIARELHDVVAHGLSSIQVQAASARYRFPALQPQVAQEFDDVAATARRAMGEMRGLLEVLRGSDAAESAPQPGLGELAELVSHPPHRGTITAELGVTAERADELGPLLGLTAYRLVQESLSNVARHAPEARVAVRVEEDADGALVISVVNAPPPGGPPGATPPAGGGHDIHGMRERVALHGGTLHAGPTAGGGFSVVAHLPSGTEKPAAPPSQEQE